ncbi:MAG: 50S ribosomal protein L29 [Chromatiales bacterium]|nr:50S ribosomal protein L29 [Chromatiales bacterium]
MDASELRKKTPAELAEELLDLRREHFNLRMQRASGQLSRTHQFTRIRRDIARIKTVLRELERKAASGGVEA